MKQFEVQLEDKPGELAKLTSILSCINIRSLTVGKTQKGEGIARFMTVDEDSTRHALNSKNFTFRENDILLVGLLDRPGELAKLTSKLSEARVNINTLQLIDRGLFALQVGKDDLDHVKTVLKDSLINV